MADLLTLHIDEDAARLLDRLLTAEFDSLQTQGRNMRTDPDVLVVGSVMRPISEWLAERGSS